MSYELKATIIDELPSDDAADFAIKRYSVDAAGVQTFTDTPFSIDQDTAAVQLGYGFAAQSVTPSTLTAVGSANLVLPGVTSVAVGANLTDTNDWTTLPSLASVPVGHCVTVVAGAANSKVRTPATSNEKINNVDSDGTQSYLLTATQVHRFTKISNTVGWMGQGFTAIGAVVTAVVPA
jgi:hypothetical protein